MTIAEYLDWLRMRGLARRTVHGRAQILTRLERRIGRPLVTATAPELHAWRRELTVGTASVANYVTAVQSFFRWAVLHGHLAGDPSLRLTVPRVPRRLPRPISEAALRAAVDAAPARIRPWLILAAYAGLRAKEIAFLRVEDLHFDEGAPYLLVSTVAAKGGRERVVPLAPVAVDALHRHGVPRRGWVFPRGDGRPGPNSPASVSARACEYLHRRGIPDTLHSLRHRFGTVAYARSQDLRLVQSLMGHADPRTTAGYVELSSRSAFELVSRLEPGRL